MFIKTIYDVTNLLEVRINERKKILTCNLDYARILATSLEPPITPEEYIKAIEQEIRVLETAIEILMQEWL